MLLDEKERTMDVIKGYVEENETMKYLGEVNQLALLVCCVYPFSLGHLYSTVYNSAYLF